MIRWSPFRLSYWSKVSHFTIPHTHNLKLVTHSSRTFFPWDNLQMVSKFAGIPSSWVWGALDQQPSCIIASRFKRWFMMKADFPSQVHSGDLYKLRYWIQTLSINFIGRLPIFTHIGISPPTCECRPRINMNFWSPHNISRWVQFKNKLVLIQTYVEGEHFISS